MKVFLWVLIAIGILISAVILLLVIILFFNVGVIIEYKDSLSFKIKVAFFDLTKHILKDNKSEKDTDDKKKKASPVKKRADEVKESIPKQEKKSLDIPYILGLISRFIEEVKKGFFKKIVIQKARIHIVSAGEDAAQTAINYGRICAALYPIIGFIDNECRVKKKDIRVQADFTQPKSTADIYLHLKLRSFHIALLALKLFLGGEKQ